MCKRSLLSSFSFAAIWKEDFTIPLSTPINLKANKQSNSTKIILFNSPFICLAQIDLFSFFQKRSSTL